MTLRRIFDLLCWRRERITVVLGAGAVLELTPAGCDWPTTEYITKSIVDEKIEILNRKTKVAKKVTLLADIYDHLCRNYHSKGGIVPAAKGSASKVHFEIIFHVLELLDTYNRSWKSTTVPEYVAPFSSFIKSNFLYDSSDFYVASRYLIEKIIEIVMVYDTRFSERRNDWYRNFWKKKRKQWDIFNLNYDTTIEQSLVSYEDGYESIPDEDAFERFNIRKLLDNTTQCSTVNHIHGCILYGYSHYKDPNHDVYEFEHHDMYKWPDVHTAKERRTGKATMHATAQNAQTIVQGPIITGLSKTDKITCLPYDVYRYNLTRSIYTNKGLLIAGYSFGDKYVNNALYRMSQCHGNKMRVVLIDFWNVGGFCEKEEGYVPKNDSELSRYTFQHYFEYGYGNAEMLLFIKRIAHQDYPLWTHFDRLSLKGPMVSDNGQLMLFIGGMKDALANHGQEIYEFLGM